MVVTAGGKPEVVAPLSEHRAEALSAISALRVGGSRATMAATMHAAQSLESAPPGPRAIIVYTHGPDEQGMLPDRLSQAVVTSEAVVNVIRTQTDALWPSVVEQAGGLVVTTNAENIVQSFGDLAATLDDQYLVTFEAPGELPAVAQVAFQTGDKEYTTVVTLPDASQAQAAPTEPSAAPSPRRALADRAVGHRARADNARCAPSPRPSAATCERRRTIHRGGQSSHRRLATGQGCCREGRPSATRRQGCAGRSHCPTTLRRPAHSGGHPHFFGGISAGAEIFVSCRRGSANGSAHPGLAAGVTAEPAEQHGQANNEAEDPPADPQARNAAEAHSAASGSEAGPKTESGLPGNPTEGGSRPAASIVFTGSGDGIVQLTKHAPGPAAVRISGNRRSNHFKVRTLGTQDVVVVTTGRYEGVRPLDWDGGNSTGFEVTAIGPWRIEVLPLSVVPTFDKSFKGEGDQSSTSPATVQSPISRLPTTDGSTMCSR